MAVFTKIPKAELFKILTDFPISQSENTKTRKYKNSQLKLYIFIIDPLPIKNFFMIQIVNNSHMVQIIRQASVKSAKSLIQ